MTGIAHVAFAYARTRALRGALLDEEDGDRLSAAEGATAQIGALHAMGIDAETPDGVRAALLERFVADADKLVRAWPIGRGLLLAVVGLVEIENVKLVFRGGENWPRFWLPLGRVAQLPLEPLRDALSLRAAVEAMQRTPYAAIASQVLRAHEQDHAAAEMALDRWASQRLLAEGRRAGGAACELAKLVVRERDLDALSRKTFAMELAATVLLREERRPPPDLEAVRRARKKACLKAFSGQPFQLASAVALLLLRIREMEAASAIAEARWGEPVVSEALRRAIAASAMGG